MREHHHRTFGLLRWLAVTLLLLFVSQIPLSAQVRGRLTGTVRDANGDTLPGATVTVRGEALQRDSAVAITDSNGRYRIGQLSPGDYEVSVELQGFATETNPSVRVGINETVSVDWTLRLETVSETVVVTSTVAAIEVSRSELATRIDAESIENLPLNGRDFEDLVNLAPGSSPALRQSTTSSSRFLVSVLRRRGLSSTAPTTTTRLTVAPSSVTPRTPFKSSRSSRAVTRRSSAGRKAASSTS